MSKLQTAFASGKFVITCELSPPKGADLSELFDKAALVKELTDAVNLTDSAAARMRMDPAAAGHALLQRGVEPVVQVTSRDKNRLALQSGMLGACALGIPNLVIMGGDPPKIGDHPQAKGVNDLFSSQIIEAARALNHGRDYAGNEIRGATGFFIGSVCNPGAADANAELENTRRKIDAGAQFFQTQAVYRAAQFESFYQKAGAPKNVLAGIIPVKSVNMANYMNERVPGIDIPKEFIARIDAAARAGNVVEESLDIAAQTIRDLRETCAGVHIMAVGWEKHIGALLSRVT